MNFTNISSDELFAIVVFIALMAAIPIFVIWASKRMRREREQFVQAVQAEDNEMIFRLYKNALPRSIELGKAFDSTPHLPPAICHALLIGDLQKARTLLDAYAGPYIKNVRAGGVELVEVNHSVDMYVLRTATPSLADRLPGVGATWKIAILDLYLATNGADGTYPATSSRAYDEMVAKLHQQVPEDARLAKFFPELQTYAEALRTLPSTPPSTPKLLLICMGLCYILLVGAGIVLFYTFTQESSL